MALDNSFAVCGGGGVSNIPRRKQWVVLSGLCVLKLNSRTRWNFVDSSNWEFIYHLFIDDY